MDEESAQQKITFIQIKPTEEAIRASSPSKTTDEDEEYLQHPLPNVRKPRPLSARSLRGPSSFSKLSRSISRILECSFYLYGKFIANNKILVILVSICVTLVCSIGLVKLKTEIRPFKLWIPQDSQFIKMQNWKTQNFPERLRVHVALYQAENILNRDVLLEILNVHDRVESLNILVTDEVPNSTFPTPRTVGWWDKCVKVPTTSLFSSLRLRRDVVPDENLIDNSSRSKRQSDWFSYLPQGSYCDIIENSKKLCLERSILEVWGYDRYVIEHLTPQNIIDDINRTNISAIFGDEINYDSLLGNIERDEMGRIVKANSALHRWVTEIENDKIISGRFIDLYGTGIEVDVDGYRWEEGFIENLSNISNVMNHTRLFFLSSSSFSNVAENTMNENLKLAPPGYVLVYVYLLFVVGKCNAVESRPLLASIGILSVIMGILISFGLCSAFGLVYSIVNDALPFLLLALGVDDMFVIMQALKNLSDDEKCLEIDERIGITMKHAGVSIAVTSATDIAAFAIGSLTVMPALRSFCVYASVGVIAIFILQITFFVAFLSFDERRIVENRSSVLCCYKFEKYNGSSCSRKNYLEIFFGKTFSNFILNKHIKRFVLVITFSSFGISCWGMSHLKQEFDPVWLFPFNTYVYKFFDEFHRTFGHSTDIAHIFLGQQNLSSEIENIEKLMEKLEANTYISEIDAWYPAFKRYEQSFDVVIPDPFMTEEDFLFDLNGFLHSASGFQFQKDFKFSRDLNCSGQTSTIKASRINFKYKRMNSTDDKLSAMKSVQTIVNNANFSGFVEAFATIHSSWESDAILKRELFTNLFLAVVVVFLITFGLLASMVQSLFVLSCVVMTLIDVMALIHWWGLTIDTASCIDLILAVGLCVDYSVHVGYAFMTFHGSRDERVRSTLKFIGPAILNGGLTTFLAFVFLGFSNSHVFITFFKIFFGVVMFGLYHGLVYLPVLLSLIGPSPYAKTTQDVHKQQKEELAGGDVTENGGDDVTEYGGDEVTGKGVHDITENAGNDVKNEKQYHITDPPPDLNYTVSSNIQMITHI